jgi:hypothetical protein
VSSFPASPHKRHTAVCGSTGCWEREGIRDPKRKQQAKRLPSGDPGQLLGEVQNPWAKVG